MTKESLHIIQNEYKMLQHFTSHSKDNNLTEGIQSPHLQYQVLSPGARVNATVPFILGKGELRVLDYYHPHCPLLNRWLGSWTRVSAKINEMQLLWNTITFPFKVPVTQAMIYCTAIDLDHIFAQYLLNYQTFNPFIPITEMLNF